MENKVGYSRRNAFVPVPTVTSFEEFNAWLWEWCEQDARRLHCRYKVSIQELWEADRESLLKLPEYPFPVFRYEARSVNRYGFAVIDTNRYGLSPTPSGKTVQAKIFFDRVVRDGNVPLCEDALSLAVENGRTDPDSIRQCYYMIAKKEFRPKPLEIKASTPKLRYDPNLTAYDSLTGGA